MPLRLDAILLHRIQHAEHDAGGVEILAVGCAGHGTPDTLGDTAFTG